MAILKISNNKTSTHAALRAVTEYVLSDKKTDSELIAGIGDFSCSDTELNAQAVYSEFTRVKKLFGKADGRQYMHAIQSFAPGESNPTHVHEIGKELAFKLWPNQQVLVVTHTDKNHLHNHFIINTVAYTDGRKLHWSKHDLSHAKAVNDSLCLEHKLSIPVNARSKTGDFKKSIWDKKLFNLLKMAADGERKSFLFECSKAVIRSMQKATNKEAFIALMHKQGWDTTWDESRKYIVFVDADNHKVRNSRLSKVLDQDISKEYLQQKFENNMKLQKSRRKIRR